MVQFFRSGQTDDRRRRVVPDDAAPASTSSVAAPARRAATGNYPADALRHKQARMADFIPQKILKIVLLFTGGVAVIAALLSVYATRIAVVAEQHLPALNVAGEGSLVNWFTSTLLLLAAVTALVVYSIRRHRLDDYHGKYRLWLVAAVAWFWLSIDEAAGLHQSLQAVATHLGGPSIPHTELLWVGTYALLFGALGLRLAFEMRASRASSTVFVLAGMVLGTAAVAHMGWLPLPDEQVRLLVEEGCEMSGSLLLLLAMSLHARYVILDSEGRLSATVKKKEKEQGAEAAPKKRRGLFGRKAKVEAAHESGRPHASRSDLESVRSKDDAAEDSDDEDDDEDDQDSDATAQDPHRLSKTERKALRRQQERQRRTRLG